MPRQHLNAGILLAAAAGAALLVTLFLDWFEPGITAWTAFEIVDLLLAAAALVAIAAAVAAPLGRPREAELAERYLPLAAVLALLLIGGALVNHPPAAVGRGVEYGAWIALGAAALLGIGTVLRTAQIALVVARRSPAPPGEDAAASPGAPGWSPPGEPGPIDAGETEPLAREGERRAPPPEAAP